MREGEKEWLLSLQFIFISLIPNVYQKCASLESRSWFRCMNYNYNSSITCSNDEDRQRRGDLSSGHDKIYERGNMWTKDLYSIYIFHLIPTIVIS